MSSRRAWPRIGAMILVLAALTTGPAESEGPAQPVRSGTILGSNPFWLGPPPCRLTADCKAWLVSGCRRALAGREPAIGTSIVDVRSIAGSLRRVRISSPVEGWLGSSYEFWSQSCRRVGSKVVTRSGDLITVPPDATWLTIPSVVGPYSWELW